MGKAPAFQFYVRDWLSDPQLRLASPSTRGIWIDLLCFMWEAPERGIITTTKERLGRMVGAENGDLGRFLDEVQELCFCDIVTHDNNKITLRNRRMHREEKKKINNKLRQKRFREKQKDNEKITPPSSSSTSSSKKYSAIFEAWWNVYPNKKSKADAFKKWESLRKKKILPDNVTLISAIQTQIEEKKYLTSKNKFCPDWKLPATWLNKQCWEDEVDLPIPTEPPPEFEEGYND